MGLLSAWVEHAEDRFGLAGWICSRRAYSGLVWEEFGGFFRLIFGSQLIFGWEFWSGFLLQFWLVYLVRDNSVLIRRGFTIIGFGLVF
jgi:hypothetical protein